MDNERVIKRPTRVEAAIAVGAIATLGLVGLSVDRANRANNERAVTEKITAEYNLEQEVHSGKAPDKDGIITVSNGDQDVHIKVRREVLGNDQARDTWSEVLIADGVDPAKLPEALTVVSGEISNNGSLSGSQPGEVAYIPDDLYLPEPPK